MVKASLNILMPVQCLTPNVVVLLLPSIIRAGYVGLCMAMKGYVWLRRAMYGCVWLCMAVYGYVWLCRAMYGYVGLCMAV